MVYYLLLGGNIGDVDTAMFQALGLMSFAGRVTAVSRIVESPPWGFEAPTSFHNCVARMESDFTPDKILALAKELEMDYGRKPKGEGEGYASRVLDIDILFADGMVVETPALTIPHPRLHLRRFTLVPLAEIAPSLRHPVLGKPVRELLAECPDDAEVKVTGPFPAERLEKIMSIKTDPFK
ncbi:2-amino-4-hydroxy-6-hydroxymethyldihydropteridine diphosphokinase [Salmonella enterica]|nr:2-amino-4-hydroxy-6-hydroxymethyldihydropteridine diphosphokinase [Salmonella enterica]